MQQWEYRSMVVAHREDGVRVDGERVDGDEAVAERLASLGQEGWELVAVTSLATDYRTPVTHGMAPTGDREKYVFKRPIPGPEPEPVPDAWAEVRELLVARERRTPDPDHWAELRELLLDRERRAALQDPPADHAEG